MSDGTNNYATMRNVMDQRMEPERYNVIGDELRKLNDKMDRLIHRQQIMETAANERYTTLAQVLVSTKLMRMALLRLERKLRKAKRKP